MLPYALIVDDFLDDFELARAVADDAEFKVRDNPHDGISYPEIIELGNIDSVRHKLTLIMGSQVSIRLMVMRRSMEGVEAPQQAHDDVSVYGSQYTMILYLNRPEHCQGGTSLLRHRATGIEVGTIEGWQQDQNDPFAWETMLMCPMLTNRAFIFPSPLIHRSEPIGGFGSRPEDARVVIACLFDLVRQ